MTTTQKARPTKPVTQNKKAREKDQAESEADDKQKEADEENNYGGRDNRPDRDVNPAEDVHVHDGEDGEPATTEHHDTQQRKDKGKI